MQFKPLLALMTLLLPFTIAAGGTHEVQPGDTLSGIASSHGIGVQAIVDANSIADPDLIFPGEVFTIPGGSSDTSSEATTTSTSSSTSTSSGSSSGGIGEPWRSLADCESGDWIDGGASFADGSARWHTGATADHLTDERPSWSNGLFYGGLQFERDSWDWAVEVGGHNVPSNPANATPEQQVAVAKTLQSIHPAGWGAWPTCSSKLNLR